MSEIALGKLHRIDAREVWKHEAHDFTPWLRQNIQLLGEALGLEIEPDVQQEVAVGLFSADLLGTDVGSNAKILVENQLEQTDHGHLGQLLTYAGGLDTDILVWVATRIREEHRQALTWLNERTHEGILFFGVEIELLRIGDSLPAPHLKVVVSPNEWQKSKSGLGGTTGGESAGNADLRRRYRAFWQSTLAAVKERDPDATSQSPENITYGSWWSIPLGRSGFFNTCAFGWEGGQRVVRCEIYIDVGDYDQNKAIFDVLHEDKDALESAFGEKLIWTRRDDIRASRIYLYRAGKILDPVDELEAIRGWAAERLLKLRDVFAPRVKALVLPLPITNGGAAMAEESSAEGPA